MMITLNHSPRRTFMTSSMRTVKAIQALEIDHGGQDFGSRQMLRQFPLGGVQGGADRLLDGLLDRQRF